MLSVVHYLGRNLPNLRGKYAFVFLGCGALVRHWPSDLTIVSNDGIPFAHCDLNDYIFKELYVYGVHELDVDWILRQLLQRGDVVVDVGASFGFHALTAAVRIGPEGHVYGVEPQPDMFALLEENIRHNRLTNVTIDRMALSDSSRTLTLYRFAGLGTGHTSVSTLDRDDYKTIVCSAITLDSYLESHNVPNVTMLKLDVEGSELAVLQGAPGLLSGAKPPMCILEINLETSHACGYHPTDLLALLKGYGYRFYRAVRGRLIRDLIGLEKCQRVAHGDNILCAIPAIHRDRLRKVGIEEHR